MPDIDALVRSTRSQLLDVLAGLDPAGWETPSLCAGWTVRHVVAHVLMPYEMSLPRFAQKMVGARLSFDRMADRWARADRRSPAELLDALRGTADRRFAVPGAPEAAPLSHLVLHGQDVYRPLGVRPELAPVVADIVLDQSVSPPARRALAPGLLDGLAFAATDTGWRTGEGDLVTGPADALLPTLAGRPAALDTLTGPGVQILRTRLLPR